MAAGSVPDLDDLELLVERCAVEPDLSVRETLTWALTRLPAEHVVRRLVTVLEGGAGGQAASQALHTLSKTGDRSAWPTAVARLHDGDDDVARTAWRCAVVLAPDGSAERLLDEFLSELGRGDPGTRLALSRAITALPEDVVTGPLERAASRGHTAVREHAADTLRLLRDPDAASAAAVARARREVALGRTRSAKG